MSGESGKTAGSPPAIYDAWFHAEIPDDVSADGLWETTSDADRQFWTGVAETLADAIRQRDAANQHRDQLVKRMLGLADQLEAEAYTAHGGFDAFRSAAAMIRKGLDI